MSLIEFDLTRWPLVVVVHPKTFERDEIERSYTAWAKLCVRGPHAALVDLRRLNPLTASPTARRRVAAAVESHRAAFERSLVAEARVIRGELTRHVVAAFDWIAGSKFSRPVCNTTSVAEAEAFLLAELERSDKRRPG